MSISFRKPHLALLSKVFYGSDGPEVSGERSWVHTGLGLPVELTCTVYSNPGTDQLIIILEYLDPTYADTKSSLIKKKRKFSSYIRKLQMGSVAKSYMS
jgi:hypothetical protein